MGGNQNTFEKRRKELDRKRRAEEKLARRRERQRNRGNAAPLNQSKSSSEG